jgi:D-arabinose 1-dehydrogenase-like Zn-dependent alcohol dehydrogenase
MCTRMWQWSTSRVRIAFCAIAVFAAVQEARADAHCYGFRNDSAVYPLEQARAAYERMRSGKARFRVVIAVA